MNALLQKLFGRTGTAPVPESVPVPPLDPHEQREAELRAALGRLNDELEQARQRQRQFWQAHVSTFQGNVCLVGASFQSVRDEWTELLRSERKILDARGEVLSELAKLKLKKELANAATT